MGPVEVVLTPAGGDIPDPQGEANTFMYRLQTGTSNSVGTLSVLVNEANATIYHVLFEY